MRWLSRRWHVCICARRKLHCEIMKYIVASRSLYILCRGACNSIMLSDELYTWKLTILYENSFQSAVEVDTWIVAGSSGRVKNAIKFQVLGSDLSRGLLDFDSTKIDPKKCPTSHAISLIRQVLYGPSIIIQDRLVPEIRRNKKQSFPPSPNSHAPRSDRAFVFFHSFGSPCLGKYCMQKVAAGCIS